MQLTGKASIRGALTAVVATLLGSGAAFGANTGSRVESSILIYSETNRVQAAEGVIGLTRPLKGRQLFNGRVTFDGLTGASPNGAAPSSHIQTFTGTSGTSTYSAKPGEIPLDDTFKDTRISFDGGFTLPLGRLSTTVLGAHLSTEHDYTSVGLNAGLTRDLFHKNTTLSASVSFSHDVVNPLGSAPTPFSQMTAPTSGGEGEGEREGGERGHAPGKGKNVVYGVVGFTQVLDRWTLLRLNYSYSHASGYLNDPYKILSVVQGPGTADPGEPTGYVYESRPDNHRKQAVYGEMRRYIGGHTIDFSYRYYHDDWGVTSRTFDVHYRFPIAAGNALQPHFRWYKQTGADFYNTYLLDGAPLPAFASADYRLAPFHAITYGLEYFVTVEHGLYLSFGAEYYRQIGDLSPPKSLGVLSRTELFPKLDAVMARVGFGYDF